MRPNRIIIACLLTLSIGVLSSCGSTSSNSSQSRSVDTAAAYIPRDVNAMALVSTDLTGTQWKAVESLAPPIGRGNRSVENMLLEAINGLAAKKPVTRKELERIIGEPMVAGWRNASGSDANDGAIYVALKVGDRELMADLIKRLGFTRKGSHSGATLYAYAYPDSEPVTLALDGDVLVFADSVEHVNTSIDAARVSKPRTSHDFDTALGGAQDGALVAGYIDAVGLIQQAGESFGDSSDDTRQTIDRAMTGSPWLKAVRTIGGALHVSRTAIDLDVAASTDDTRLKERDLPFPTGTTTPEVIAQVQGAMSSASANQSQTTTFLYATFVAAFPDSKFAKQVAAVEAKLHVDFEDDVLRQFNGPSQTIVEPSGNLAARSTVADPGKMRAMLPDLAPLIPNLVESLRPLRSQGLAILMLLAPDAPAPATPMSGVQVAHESLPDGSVLYHLTGVKDVPGLPPGPKELYYGMVGDVFVVGTTRDRVLGIVDMKTTSVKGAEGGVVAHLDIANMKLSDSAWLSSMGFLDPELIRSLGIVSADAWVAADRKLTRFHGRVTIDPDKQVARRDRDVPSD